MAISGEMNIVYFSHGGGPFPLLKEKSHLAMVEFLARLAVSLKKPDLIVVVSAHWEQQQPTLLGSAVTPLLYDYYGFPPETYAVKYPIMAPAGVLENLQKFLKGHGIATNIDSERGYDHGVFIPLRLMYPNADIPVVQLSLLEGLDPSRHIALGNALGRLELGNVLIIGSGFSFHNMREFNLRENIPDPRNDAFQDWLIEKCTKSATKELAEADLIHWERAPYARYCHPREEHLLPLHVCLGASSGSATLLFDDYIAGKRSIALHWRRP